MFTATTKHTFLAMKIVKTRLQNKINNDFCADILVLYIEKDFVEILNLDSIFDDFKDTKERHVTL